ncbi:cellulose biosynthesis protein BcsG [Chromobacterium sp. IIBBL 290-4]|uniref:cellulose biosynthesis protein BcsG n=1 Tax=Chromobacterium sp. IIBBL 290-4 TaxID=2953890 RepID=UPI0020B66074|nr:cellulose biosynthesis protein BcsG [Chromobacterium sp. IIBBL 290-4]UTH73445.1 cellulose biosynthesis protein BcsG [Chromobacterium sp. IIBBL 290-4]
MSQTTSAAATKANEPLKASGLGGWNFYFIAKLLMAWRGMLNLHPLPNLAFALLLLLPARRRGPRILRAMLAWCAAGALLYHDTWLPPPEQALPQVALMLKGFSFSYLLELTERIVTPQLLTAFAALLGGYLLLSRYLRLATLVLAALLWLSGKQLWQERAPEPAMVAASATAASGGAQSAPQTPTQQLDAFFQEQAQQKVSFPGPLADPSFDVLLIHVCSLSWDDLKAIGFEHHSLLSKFDIVFNNFNSAASYSGPAALRVLRATCGQPRHSALYEGAPDDCFLFKNLAKLGFKTEITMNHDGSFDGFLQQIRSYGKLNEPLLNQQQLPVSLRAFDSSPIYNDYAALNRWLQLRGQDGSPHVATYYNTISLHDGNRIPEAPGLDTNESYKYRATRVLHDIEQFIDQLEQSHRKVILLFVPEHGAALRGDKLQFSGLREIPTPRITIVPAGIKVIGGQAKITQQRIDQAVSYTAVSTILSRMLVKSPFGADYRPESYTHDLPGTPFVSESSSFVMMQNGQRFLMRQSGGDWTEYAP